VRRDVEKIGKELGVDSIGYLTIDDLLDPPPGTRGTITVPPAFSGRYPVPIDANQSKKSMKREFLTVSNLLSIFRALLSIPFALVMLLPRSRSVLGHGNPPSRGAYRQA